MRDISYGLHGKRVLVVGGTGDIADALLPALRIEGCSIAVGVAGEAVTEPTLGKPTDMADAFAVKHLIDAASKELGGLDAVIINLVVEEKEHIFDSDANSWDRQHTHNLRAPFLIAKYAAEQLHNEGGGTIVGLGSIAGVVFWPRTVAYNATRGGLIALLKSLALELAPANIRVNGVLAGHVETDREYERLQDARFARKPSQILPLGRLGRPEELVGPTSSSSAQHRVS